MWQLLLLPALLFKQLCLATPVLAGAVAGAARHSCCYLNRSSSYVWLPLRLLLLLLQNRSCRNIIHCWKSSACCNWSCNNCCGNCCYHCGCFSSSSAFVAAEYFSPSRPLDTEQSWSSSLHRSFNIRGASMGVVRFHALMMQ